MLEMSWNASNLARRSRGKNASAKGNFKSGYNRPIKRRKMSMPELIEKCLDERRDCDQCQENMRCLVRLNRLEMKLVNARGAGKQDLSGDFSESPNPNRVAKLNRLIRELRHSLHRKD